MKYLIATPDKAKYVKLYSRPLDGFVASPVFTIERKLAMQFASKSEANRFIMTALGRGMVNEYVVVKEGE